MKHAKPLPTQNEEWGFWGTCNQSGYDTAKAWNAASQFFIKIFNLTPEQARELLDARFGRHLADDLSFIKGEKDERSITKHLGKRYADAGWRKHFEKSIYDVTGKKVVSLKPTTKDELFKKIAQQHLNIETLEERKSDSLDFKEVAVWSVKAALEAAFEAGKAAAKKGA
jgi:ABC-type amino acid transport substrate-binding protein